MKIRIEEQRFGSSTLFKVFLIEDLFRLPFGICLGETKKLLHSFPDYNTAVRYSKEFLEPYKPQALKTVEMGISNNIIYLNNING